LVGKSGPPPLHWLKKASLSKRTEPESTKIAPSRIWNPMTQAHSSRRGACAHAFIFPADKFLDEKPVAQIAELGLLREGGCFLLLVALPSTRLPPQCEEPRRPVADRSELAGHLLLHRPKAHCSRLPRLQVQGIAAAGLEVLAAVALPQHVCDVVARVFRQVKALHLLRC
jgi:hypothetical protein